MSSPSYIVVPCFNEATRLPADEFVAFARQHDDVRFVFVDDGSTDDTLGVLQALCGQLGGSGEVLPLAQNGGKGEAVRAGLRHAFATGALIAGFWDADLSTPLGDVRVFRARLDAHPETTAVLGARVAMLGRPVHRELYRHLYGRAFATAVSTMLSLAVYDTQCGAKLFRRSADLDAVLSEPFATRWLFDIELIVRLLERCELRGQGRDADALFVEEPVSRWRDVPGSKVSAMDGVRAFAQLAAIERRHRAALAARRRRLG